MTTIRFLERLDKSLFKPRVIYEDNPLIGGQYLRPRPGEVFIAGRAIEATRGIIIVSMANFTTIAEEEAVLAHEWYHHWQYHRGKMDHSRWEWDGREESYDRTLIDYFNAYPGEMEALLFELSFSQGKPWSHEHWINLLALQPNRLKKGAWR